MKTVQTFTATVYVGLKERDSGFVHAHAEIEDVCQGYCDERGLCVTVTPTTFIYTNGQEPGAAVGLINYPRFPADGAEIKEHAVKLAHLLKEAVGQCRVSIVFADETVMIGEGPGFGEA